MPAAILLDTFSRFMVPSASSSLGAASRLPASLSAWLPDGAADAEADETGSLPSRLVELNVLERWEKYGQSNCVKYDQDSLEKYDQNIFKKYSQGNCVNYSDRYDQGTFDKCGQDIADKQDLVIKKLINDGLLQGEFTIIYFN